MRAEGTGGEAYGPFPAQPDAEISVISPTTIWPSVEPSPERQPVVLQEEPAPAAQPMRPPAIVPERLERAPQVTFLPEVQTEMILVEASPAEEPAEFVPEFGGETSPEPDSETPLATGVGAVATAETRVRVSGDAPAAVPVSGRWADEGEDDSGNAHAPSIPFDSRSLERPRRISRRSSQPDQQPEYKLRSAWSPIRRPRVPPTRKRSS